MAETNDGATTAPTNPAANEPHGNEPQQEPEKDWKAEYEKALAQSRKWEQRSKANADAAKKLAELEDSTKTDAEKLADATKRAEEAEAKVKEYEAKAERAGIVSEVAAAKGVDADLLARMAGDTREEVEANADYISQKLGPTGTSPSIPA